MWFVLFKGTYYLFLKRPVSEDKQLTSVSINKFGKIDLIPFSRGFSCAWDDPQYSSKRVEACPVRQSPAISSVRTQAGSSFSNQFLEEDLGFKPGGWRVNTAAQGLVHRESTLSHVPTFLFTVPAMVRWGKVMPSVQPKFHFQIMGWVLFCWSIWWLDRSHWANNICASQWTTVGGTKKLAESGNLPQTAWDKARKSYSSCIPSASSMAICWGKLSAGIQGCNHGLSWAWGWSWRMWADWAGGHSCEYMDFPNHFWFRHVLTLMQLQWSIDLVLVYNLEII